MPPQLTLYFVNSKFRVAKLAWIAEKFYKITGEGVVPEGTVTIVDSLKDNRTGGHRDVNHETIQNNPGLNFALLDCALCNSSTLTFDEKDQRWKVTGDPTEVALEVFAHKCAVLKKE